MAFVGNIKQYTVKITHETYSAASITPISTPIKSQYDEKRFFVIFDHSLRPKMGVVNFRTFPLIFGLTTFFWYNSTLKSNN